MLSTSAIIFQGKFFNPGKFIEEKNLEAQPSEAKQKSSYIVLLSLELKQIKFIFSEYVLAPSSNAI